MNTTTRSWRGRPWQLMLLAVLLAWLLPERAAATHVDDTWKYQVALNGANTVRIQAPVYDQEGADCWVSDGNLKVVVDGVEKTCFHWCRDGDTDSKSSDIYIHFSTEVGGSFDITQGNSGNHFTMTQSGYYKNLVYRNSDGNTYTVYAVWRVPYEYLGKTLKFKWDVERDGNSRSKKKVSGLSDVEVPMPDAPEVIHPQVTMASMSYSVAGKMELPWFIASKTITALRYEYIDAYGITVRNDIPTNENNGTIYLDATVPHDNFCVVASYKDSNEDEINNVSSTIQNLTIIHAPVGLTATQIGDVKAKVRLDWHVRYPSTDDLATSDYFEVQRSLTGQEADFVTIGTVPVVFDDKNPHFAYTDSTIVNALVAEHLTGGSSLPNLTYRVRRMITQTWGWDGNPCAQRVQTSVGGLHLQRLKSYSAQWADERAYTVRVDWEYVKEPNAVWDSRAKLMMVVTMRNNAGGLVDTKTFELTDEERSARTKTIDLSRTCVKYDIRMYVDPGTSPLRSWDQPDAMRIASVADWNTFVNKVKEANGQYDVNAVLCANITTDQYCGEDGKPFRGTFDGNGHTLTFNRSGWTSQYIAPFRLVRDATIRNLHTAGTIGSNQKFIGGIVGQADGNVVIENCHSSVNISSTVNGDATNGGIVAVKTTNGQLTITDCLFDGAFTGSSCYANGGFVGWSEGKINIVNGHFAPSKIETQYTGSRTWARMRDSKNLTVTNSHFTKSYDESTTDLLIIRSKADWTTFRTAVEDAKGEKDVNAILDTDLSLTNEDIVGTDYPYRGTFDGNGHTLNIDIDGYVYFGLFKNVTSSTTIRNLRVTGKVKGRFGFASLVGKCSEKCTDLNIDHVRVSTDLTSNIEQNGIMGGFVGLVEKGTKVNITDCLYDGNFVTTLDFKACFIASASQPNFYDWHQTRVYEHSTGDNGGIYSLNNYIGQSPHNGGWHAWSDNNVCLSSHYTKLGFEKVPEDCRNITKPDTVLARMNASLPGQWEKDGSGNAVPIIGMTSVRLLAALGSGWQMTGSTVVPKTATVSVNPSALPDFYHEGTGRIDKVAHAETRQSSVVLTWTTEDGVLDYFEVYRRVKGTTEWGEPIATGIDRMGYEDTTVSPLLKYEYKVVAVTDCEGLHTSETDVVEGFCKNTGRVSGYVRMNDGTGVAGIEVEIAPSDSPEGGATVTVTTDDKGYFVADELSYYGQQSITYNVTPVARDNIKLERGTMPVEFNSKSNDETLPDFIITSGHRFSGYVMYEGTSIPVKGAHFRVDGNDVHNAAGELLEALVNKTGKAVYWSKVAEGHEDFGTIGAYEMIKPAGKTGLQDEILEKYNNMVCWIEMIMANEREKLWAYDKLANYDVDGGGTVTHSETFESEYSQSQYISYPFTTADYFENDGQDRWDRLAASAGALLSQPALASGLKALTGLINMRNANNNGDNGGNDNNNNAKEARIKFWGQEWSFSIKPVAEYSSTGTYGSQNNYSRKESFNLVMDSKSHLSVDVFRVFTEATDTTTTKSTSWLDVYHNANFNEWLEIVKNHVKDGVSYEGITYSKSIYPRSFIYRTRGGATANPWENARYTIAYQPGTLLDERTKKIENPKITADRQSVSGVPYGETARFTIYLTNDSEDPEAGGRSLTTYNLYVDDSSNPYGAKITCDGKPLDTSGRSVILMPGEVVTKVIEVTGGNSFDLEGLTIGIASEQDWRQIYDELTLDVHYLHQAGPVNISLPGDKWVMNTYAQYDNDRGWFMPVIIDGFDRHQHNFDHIELQYKETLRGDDAWTNLCSFYADATLMEAASGVRELIPENGNIETQFYGEGTVMEKAYDLRAVLYCRNGNSFLTTSSPIVSGVKDTRRPQLFGTPEPKDGILRLGGNIIFNFSEDIEYNYLNAITNFEVKGEVNNDNVTDAVSLQFTGNGSVESEAQRNFSGKDLTIDLMVRPDKTGRDMPLFSHGTNGKKLQLWLTGDYHLKAIIDDQTFVSTDTIVKSGFTQVALVLTQPSLSSVAGDFQSPTIAFYNGGKQLGSFKMTEPYNGTGRLIFGRTNETDRSKSQYYEGRMMEARLWYRAMTGGQVGTTYGSRRLTGYEMGLVDYYPMNEGTGDYALDKTQGANAQLMGASWAMPRGWSLSLDNGGVALTQQALARTAEQDYTMMFWFKTADADGTLVSNGSGEKDEAGAENHFWLGFDDGTLAFRSNGMTVEAGSGYNDDQWHHYAMTVNRARGVANIYVDQALKATFAPDSLGGISGGTPCIGGMMEFVTGTRVTDAKFTDNIAESPFVFSGSGTQTDIPQQAPEVKNTVDLSTLTTDYEAQDGDALTGTLGANVKISIADGATVTLDGVTIEGKNSSSYKWAGINCPGDATIFLKGENTVNGFYENYPGIFIAEGKTLTIRGNGSLTAFNDFAAGIGGIYNNNCGNIVIEGGIINASSRVHAAGIGSGYNAACGDITIKGGTITAKGGAASPGIGCAAYGSCGNITITGGTVSAAGYLYNAAAIGGGLSSSCGNITITGGTINAVGGYDGPGIGSGEDGSCGDITITDDVVSVTATKDQHANNTIGAGNRGTVGNVTIGGNYTEFFETNFKSDYKGRLDELCMFQQALPLTLIKAYATKSPQGDEAGLLTYLAFDRQERQKDNDIETVAYTWSKKIYLDDRGEVRYELDPVTKQATTTPVRDYVFVGSADEILRHITNETAAPVVPYEELTNLKFSFAGKDNQVLVELDELTQRINRRNIYVTLRDVEDKNGNAMVSPQTACYYVTNSSLRWLNERQTCLASYGYEDYIYFDILNNSATSHTYTIENCPRWLDMEAYTGIIGPLGTVTIRGVVNKSLNVGTYDEIIYLTDEDGVAEPLYLNLTVTTSAPEWSWSVDDDLLKYSMNIAGQVILNGEVDIDSRDIVGVFDRENRCHGIAHVNYSALTGESDLFLTVYDSSKSGKELFFKLWQYSTGRELVLTADGKGSMTFQSDASYGIDTPVRFEGGELYVQTFDLKEGWNWVSFNVASEKLFNLNTLLDGLPWQNGDVLTEMSGSTTLTYTNGTWLATGGVKSLRISPRKGYAIKVAQDTEFPVGGNIIKSEDARTIIVNNGWNGIGYTPMLNLSVETALSDYYDKATPGDIIKSHDEFAYFTKTGGTGRWRGSLEYMKPGQGYMLLRKAEGEALFRYPFYEPGSTFLDAWAVAGSRGAAEEGSAGDPALGSAGDPARNTADDTILGSAGDPARNTGNGDATAVSDASPSGLHRYRHTMSLCAVIEGFEPEDGDRLVAYADGEVVGHASQRGSETTEPLYLTIGGEKPADIWFAIERNGDIVASTGNVLTFRTDDVVGTPDEPFAIRFAASATGISLLDGDYEPGKWYTVNGIQLPQRPKRKGVYIYNGNKIVIK